MAHINPEKVLSDVKTGVAQMKTADAMRGGMMGPMMMGNMMGDGMMDSMMGPMMGGMMSGGMATEGMNLARAAPKARMLAKAVEVGTVASVASALPRTSPLSQLLRNPYLVVGLGIVTGYLIHKYRNDIIRLTLGQETRGSVCGSEPGAP